MNHAMLTRLELSQIRAKVAKNCVTLTKPSYQKLMDDVKKAKGTIKKKPRECLVMKQYNVMMV